MRTMATTQMSVTMTAVITNVPHSNHVTSVAVSGIPTVAKAERTT